MAAVINDAGYGTPTKANLFPFSMQETPGGKGVCRGVLHDAA